ncbi:amidase [Parendozoicomonas haliclonae]|uniref:Acylamidase n=1 Tax=Parendozoicomonas haliclonae TaxID=1960125 RepID=A0A1X7ANT2_9GAMM|nr:amidase [Parendozoicomonas haliclonae]SMA49946.1 Acylamidase [Parendozoicomonas haliclonae]
MDKPKETAVHKLSAQELLTAYKQRTLSPVDVMQATLDRVERLNPQLNALYHLAPEQALAEARESEQRWLKGQPKGLLDGIPTSVKDALPVSGMPVYRGSAATADSGEYPKENCPAVDRLQEQGAIVYGKSTMCDFGILPAGYSSRFGPTRNPINPAFNTGGSSSGAAAAVAAGFEPLSLGTDIVGSIRLPASFCGLYGLKPSQGRVPYYFPNNPALVAGPMTRTVADAALMMNVITQPDKRDFTALLYDKVNYLDFLDKRPRNATVGLLTDLGFGTPVDSEVAKAVQSAGEAFRELGFAVQEIASPFREADERCAERYYMGRCSAEFHNCAEAQKPRAEVIQQWVTDIADHSATAFFNDWLAMQKLREKAYQMMADVDFLLLPSVPVPAYAGELPAADPDKLFEPWVNNFLFNLTGQPAASINCGYTEAGLPIGLQIVGKRFDDLGVLQMSALFEKAFVEQNGTPVLAGLEL